MSKTLFKNTTKLILTDVEHDGVNIPNFLITGAVVLDVSTSDKNTTVTTTENLTLADWENNIPGHITIVSVVKSKDHDTYAAISPAVTNPDLDVETNVVESEIDDTFVITITSKVTYNISPMYLFAETTQWTNLGIAEEHIYRYLILRHNLISNVLHGNPGGDYYMTCEEMYSIMNITCVKMSEGLYQTLRQTWLEEKVIEIDEETAFYGSKFFGEIRSVAKLWEAKTPWYGEKIPTEITPEIVGYILKVMKIFAKSIIEVEYERRFLVLKNASTLEAESWIIQKQEAKEWLTYGNTDGHITPLLDYIASERGLDKTQLANKILEKSEIYQDKMSHLLVEMQILLKKFEDCSSVWDINILYEDCFGIGMPIKQAAELGRTVDAEGYIRKPEWKVKGNGYYF